MRLEFQMVESRDFPLWSLKKKSCALSLCFVIWWRKIHSASLPMGRDMILLFYFFQKHAEALFKLQLGMKSFLLALCSMVTPDCRSFHVVPSVPQRLLTSRMFLSLKRYSVIFG